MPIRTGSGVSLTPKGVAEVRKGDGTVLFSATVDAFYDVEITDAYESVDGFDVTITDQRFVEA